MDLSALGRVPAVRWSLYVLAGLVGVHVLAALALLGLQRAHVDEVLPGVEVAEVDVGGLTRAELASRVDDLGRRRLQAPVHVVAEGAALEAERGDLGLEVATAVVVDAAWDRGRRGLWRALYDQVAARAGGTLPVGLEARLDEDRLERWAAAAAEELSRPATPAEIVFRVVDAPDEVEVDTDTARQGLEVDPADVADRVADRVPESGPIEVEVPAETTAPATTDDDVEAILPDARLAVSAPVTLANPSPAEDLALAPADLARVVTVEHDGDADEGERLALAVTGETLTDHLGEDGLAALETTAVEARFEVDGDTVDVVGGTPGFDVDVAATAEQVLALATDEAPREDELPGEETSPELTRRQAEELGIVEEVSSFSTSLVPGESRNQNIHRGADLFDHSLVHPGETFSLNEAIGPRTRERGFVENGFIDADGDLTEVVGGGSSQLGTTFMNAAWFAGIDLVEFQPHSLYFERYPMGREATLSYNTIDVVVTNDSPHGLLIVTSHTESSVTVRILSTSWADVDSWTGDPFNRVEGEERDGFDIEFGRDITYPDGTSTSEEYFHRYEPED